MTALAAGALLTSEPVRAETPAASPAPFTLQTPSGRSYPPLLPYVGTPKNALTQVRAAHMFPSLRTSYSSPLLLVTGRGQYMFDEQSRRYIDTYNNIPHIGHCHPVFVEATSQQLAQVVSNTRYLHQNVTLLAQRIASTTPDPLSVVMFTNSGSEANDLALRMVLVATGGKKGIVCLEGAYHGTTLMTAAISPHPTYSEGRDLLDLSHVEVALIPDTYRGPYSGQDPDAGKKFAASVADAIARLEARGVRFGCFIAETFPGCAGNIVPPPGYLKEVYEIVRRAGGICIADEVQTGFGRSGAGYWAFETQGVVPDIVTTGKSIGNGLPIACAITTPAIARAFSGHEFFSSVAGNPVSAAAGLAVMHVVAEDRLQQNAASVGAYWLSALQSLQTRHALIGDVRGMGLWLAVEFVQNRATKAPASTQARQVVEQMLERRFLCGALGIHGNVLRLKPPLCFTKADVDEFMAALEQSLATVTMRQTAKY